MQALQRWLPRLLVLGAIGVVVAALFSDHKTAYGSVPLPQGGVVSLPEGKSKVYLDEIMLGDPSGDPRRLTGLLSFSVVPVGGGGPLTIDPFDGDVPGQLTERSQGIGTKDAVAEVDAPSAGDYRVSGSYDSDATASLSFGTDPFTAVMEEWRIWGGMLLGAFLISLLPTRRYRSKDGSAPTESGEQAPAAASSGFSPYRG